MKKKLKVSTSLKRQNQNGFEIGYPQGFIVILLGLMFIPTLGFNAISLITAIPIVLFGISSLIYIFIIRNRAKIKECISAILSKSLATAYFISFIGSMPLAFIYGDKIGLLLSLFTFDMNDTIMHLQFHCN